MLEIPDILRIIRDKKGYVRCLSQKGVYAHDQVTYAFYQSYLCDSERLSPCLT